MADIKETTILQEGPIKITNQRTVIGTLTYSMSDIRSISVTKRAKSYKPLWLVIVGILLIRWVQIEESGQFLEFFNIGIVLILVGIALVMIAKPTYAVKIGRVSGDDSILRSTNRTFIQRIADAMNNAITCRE